MTQHEHDADRQTATSNDSAPLGVWDAGSLIVGMVIGASLFRVPGLVFANAGDTTAGLLLWLLGGLLSLAGALCYCELATTYPRLGGDYVYLNRAFGPAIGFLFGWMRFTVILPANVGAMGFIFADHALRLARSSSVSAAVLAAGSIVLLTLVNLRGALLGKRVQNLLTVSKLVGLCLIVAAGVWLATSESVGQPAPASSTGTPNYGLAMVFVLYAFGGWSDAAFVAAEVRDVRRNMPRALILGLGSISVIYFVVNLSYVSGLGFDGVCSSSTPAAELLMRAFGSVGEAAVSLIVMLSTLGAMNGMLYSGSRLTASLGVEHRVLRFLGGWSAERGAPVRSLLAIGGLSLAFVWFVGTSVGKSVLDAVLGSLGAQASSWQPGEAGFDLLVVGAAPTFWLFFCLTAAAVPLLRLREPEVERPFHCGVAVTPLILFATSAYMLWSSLAYAQGLAWLGFLVLGAGIVAYFVSSRAR